MKELIERCKAGIYLEVNPHKDDYLSVEEYFQTYHDEEFESFKNTPDYLKSIELDTIIKLQFYPRTPISCYIIIGYDLDKVIEEALETLNNE